MKNILFNVELLDRYYIFYIDDKINKIYGHCLIKNERAYGVTESKEVIFLNQILNFINKKYIKRKDILYCDEYLKRYINRYNGMSYFAREIDGNTIPIPYEEARDLYDSYNLPKINYIGKRGKNRAEPRYDNYNYSDLSYQYNSSKGIGGRKNNGKGLKLLFAIAGTVATITLSSFAVGYLSNGGKIPFLSPSEIEQKYGDVDLKVDTDSEEKLKKKYESVKEQLEESGLENWQISKELDRLSVFQGDSDDINFYYDSEKDAVIFVYEKLEDRDITSQENENNKEILEEPTSSIKEIQSVIQNNEKLSDKEKEFIISKISSELIENKDYINVEELKYRFNILDINYEYYENGKELSENSDYPSTYRRKSGQYATPYYGYEQFEEIKKMCEEYGNSVEKTIGGQGVITMFNGTNLEDSVMKEEKVILHELGHVIGNFEGETLLLNEGYTSLRVKDSSYKKEQLLASMMIETFGSETIREGYYGFNLTNALTNKIVEKTGRDNTEVYDEVTSFLEDIQEVLYKTGSLEETEFRKDSSLMKDYNSLFSKFEQYYKEINEQEMSDNILMNAIQDYFQGTNDRTYLDKDEYINNISCNIDGSADITVQKLNTAFSYILEGQKVENSGSFETINYHISNEEKRKYKNINSC